MPRIDQDWIRRPETRAVLDALNGAGGTGWLVGGCVRDALMGRPVSDVDIATDLVPEAVALAIEAVGLRAVPTGIDHGTITAVSGDLAHEITTLRRDVATDGRRATVAFSTDIAEDAARRDFTLNALYADRNGEVIDPLGQGLADLADRRIRFIGDPRDRIDEDCLRILRYFRFLASHGDPRNGADPEALAAIADRAGCLPRLSRERIGHEMRRLLSAPDPAPVAGTMAACGVLPAILPGAETRALAPLIHAETDLGLTPDPIRRLAALGGMSSESDLRLSRAEAKRLAQLTEDAAATTPPSELGYRRGADYALAALALRSALLETPPDPTWPEQVKDGASRSFPVTAADLMPGLQGPALGARLADLEDRWIGSGFRLSKAELLGLD